MRSKIFVLTAFLATFAMNAEGSRFPTLTTIEGSTQGNNNKAPVSVQRLGRSLVTEEENWGIMQREMVEDPCNATLSDGDAIYLEGLGNCPLFFKETDRWCNNEVLDYCFGSFDECCETNAAAVSITVIVFVLIVAGITIGSCACCSCCPLHEKLCCAARREHQAGGGTHTTTSSNIYAAAVPIYPVAPSHVDPELNVKQ